FRLRLQVQVQGRVNVQAAAVHHFVAVKVQQLPQHVGDEMGRYVAGLIVLTENDRLLPGLPGFFFGDIAHFHHPIEDDGPAAEGGLHLAPRGIVARVPQQAGDEGRFRQVQLPHALAEVYPAGGFDAVGAVAEVHVVEVRLQNFIVRVLSYDLDRPQHFLQLAGDRAVVGEEGVASQLLGDGARALKAAGSSQVNPEGPGDADEVQPPVFVEAVVFHSDDRGSQSPWNVFQVHRDAVFPEKAGDGPAFPVVNVGGQFRVENDVLQRRGAL